MGIAVEEIPGFLLFDHVAVSVKVGDLEKQVTAYKVMGFRENPPRRCSGKRSGA
jgi:hypothetical protein